MNTTHTQTGNNYSISFSISFLAVSTNTRATCTCDTCNRLCSIKICKQHQEVDVVELKFNSFFFRLMAFWGEVKRVITMTNIKMPRNKKPASKNVITSVNTKSTLESSFRLVQDLRNTRKYNSEGRRRVYSNFSQHVHSETFNYDEGDFRYCST